MIAKKNPKMDLEKKRFAFFQIGLILSGAMCLAAFEYSSVSVNPETYVHSDDKDMGTIDPPLREPNFEPEKTQKQVVTKIIDDVKVVDKPVVEPTFAVDTSDIIVNDKITYNIDSVSSGNKGFVVEPYVENPNVDPEFPGGIAAMGEFIRKNIKLPAYIPEYDQGTVYVKFLVNSDGTIKDVVIARGLSAELDKAALKVVAAMPRWKPAENDGYKVQTRITVPIRIIIQ